MDELLERLHRSPLHRRLAATRPNVANELYRVWLHVVRGDGRAWACRQIFAAQTARIWAKGSIAAIGGYFDG